MFAYFTFWVIDSETKRGHWLFERTTSAEYPTRKTFLMDSTNGTYTFARHHKRVVFIFSFLQTETAFSLSVFAKGELYWTLLFFLSNFLVVQHVLETKSLISNDDFISLSYAFAFSARFHPQLEMIWSFDLESVGLGETFFKGEYNFVFCQYLWISMNKARIRVKFNSC